MLYLLTILFCLVVSASNALYGPDDPSFRMSEAALNSSHFGEAVRLTTKRFNELNGGSIWYQSKEIRNAKKRLIKGTLYEFTIEFEPTHCSKTLMLSPFMSEHALLCTSIKTSPAISCSAQVWTRLWTNRSVIVNLENCWKHQELDVESDGFQEVYTPVDELHFRTRIFQKALTEIESIIIKKSGVSLEIPFTRSVYWVESLIFNEPILRVTLSWIRSGCENLGNPNVSDCEKFTSHTCGAQCAWPFCSNSTSIQVLDCVTTELQSAEMEPFVFFRKQHLDTLTTYSMTNWTKKELPWSMLAATDHYSVSSVWLDRACRRYKENHYSYFDCEAKPVGLVTKQVEPFELLTFRVLLRLPYCVANPEYYECNRGNRYSDSLCTAVVVEKTEDVRLEDCQRTTMTITSNLPMEDRSRPWFVQAMDFVVDKFNSLSRMETSFVLHNVEKAEVLDEEIIQILVTFEASVCQARSMVDQELSAFITPCKSEKKHVQCEVKVFNKTLLRLLPRIDFEECWQFDRLPEKMITQWLAVDPNEFSQIGWQTLLNETWLMYKGQFEHPFKATHFYLRNAYVQSGNTGLLLFELHVEMDEFSDLKHVSHVTAKKSSELKFNISVYGCHARYNQHKGDMSDWRTMTEAEKNSTTFQKLVSALDTKTKEKNHFTRIVIKDALLKMQQIILVQFRMNIQEYNCTRRSLDRYQRESNNCIASEFLIASDCRVTAWTTSWFHPFVGINITDCSFSTQAPMNFKTSRNKYGNVFSEVEYQTTVSKMLATFHELSLLPQYHSVFMSENFTLEENDVVLRKSFDLYLTPNSAEQKTPEFLLHPDAFQKMNGEYVVYCKATSEDWKITPTVNTIRLSGCKQVHLVQLAEDESRSTQKDIHPNQPNVTNLAMKIVDMFQNSTLPFRSFKVFSVDRQRHGNVLGQLTSFRLLMAPSSDSFESMVSCQVRHWVRPWQRHRETLEVGNCHTVNSREDFNLVKKRTHLQNPSEFLNYLREQYGNKLIYMLRQQGGTFEDAHTLYQIRLGHLHGSFGLNVSFDFDVPIIASESENQKQTDLPQFITCNGSLNEYPWLQNQSHLKIVRCTKVSMNPLNRTEPATEPIPINKTEATIHDLQRKAVRDIQDEYDLDVKRYTLITTDNVHSEIEAGVKISFDIIMNPKICSVTTTDQLCKSAFVSHQIKCTVFAWIRPWESLPVYPHIQHCRKVFDNSTKLNPSDFHEVLQSWVSTNNSFNMNVQYAVDEVENFTMELDRGRNISFVVCFKPVACSLVLPWTMECSCLDWQMTSRICCSVFVYDSNRFSEPQISRTTDCRFVVRPETEDQSAQCGSMCNQEHSDSVTTAAEESIPQNANYTEQLILSEAKSATVLSTLGG